MANAIGTILSHHPVDKQQPPRWWRPVWRVGHLSYQGGNPILKLSSYVGSGFLPFKTLAGKQSNAWHAQASPITSNTGGGNLPARPNFLTPLGGGAHTTQF